MTEQAVRGGTGHAHEHGDLEVLLYGRADRVRDTLNRARERCGRHTPSLTTRASGDPHSLRASASATGCGSWALNRRARGCSRCAPAAVRRASAGGG
jgi:hypothetical protein